MLLEQLSSSHSIDNLWAYSFACPRESHDHSAFPTWWRGFFLPGLVPPNDMVDSESIVSMKPGDSGAVIGYQVNEFSHT